MNRDFPGELSELCGHGGLATAVLPLDAESTPGKRPYSSHSSSILPCRGWSRAFLSMATHGHRRKAQVFRPRYAVPKASNSKLNAAIQAGSTRCDIPTKMAQKHKTGHRKIMDSPAPLDG
jgi:hypothetical protein